MHFFLSSPPLHFFLALTLGQYILFGGFTGSKVSLGKSNQFKTPLSKSKCSSINICVRERTTFTRRKSVQARRSATAKDHRPFCVSKETLTVGERPRSRPGRASHTNRPEFRL